MSAWFRCALVLMVVGCYGYGDHVSDPAAHMLRCRKLLRRVHALHR